MTTKNALGHVAVTTPDLDRLRRFYENTLDLHLVAIEHTLPAPVKRLGIFAAGSGVTLLAFEVPGADVDSSGGLGQRGSIDHFTFHVDALADLEAVASRLVAAGASDGAVVPRGPMHSVFFRDPDGRALNVTCPNPAWSPSPSLEIVDTDRFAGIHPADQLTAG